MNGLAKHSYDVTPNDIQGYITHLLHPLKQ